MRAWSIVALLALGFYAWPSLATDRPVITSPKNQARTNTDNGLSVGGTATVSKVQVIVDGDKTGLISKTINCDNGGWDWVLSPNEYKNLSRNSKVTIRANPDGKPEDYSEIEITPDNIPPAIAQVAKPKPNALLGRADVEVVDGKSQVRIEGSFVAEAADTAVRVMVGVYSLDEKKYVYSDYATTTSLVGWSADVRLGDGQYEIQVQSIDGADNRSVSSSIGFSLDTIGPSLSLARIDQGGYINEEQYNRDMGVKVQGEVEKESKVDVYITKSSSPPSTLPVLPVPVSDGKWSLVQRLVDDEYSVRVEAFDKAGNKSEVASSVFVLDTRAPRTNFVTDKVAKNTNLLDAEFGFSSPDADTRDFVCEFDGDLKSEYCSGKNTNGVTLTGLDVKQHSFVVRARDAAGNVDKTVQVFFWIVNNIPPLIEAREPVSGASTKNVKPPVKGYIDKPGSEVLVTLTKEGGSKSFSSRVPTAGTSWSFENYGTLEEGVYAVSVSATDTYGNFGQLPGSWTFTVDTTSPKTYFEARPAGVETRGTSIFIFGSDDNKAVFECSLDGKPMQEKYLPCAKTMVYSDLDNGEHALKVRAVDAAGNDADPIEYRWVVESALENVQDGVTYDQGSGAFTCGSSGASTGFPLPLFGWAALVFLCARQKGRMKGA